MKEKIKDMRADIGAGLAVVRQQCGVRFFYSKLIIGPQNIESHESPLVLDPTGLNYVFDIFLITTYSSYLLCVINRYMLQSAIKLCRVCTCLRCKEKG